MRTPNKQMQDIKQSKIQSPFIKYCITTVCCLLMCGAGFLFLVFGSNSLYTMDATDVASKQSSVQQINVSTVVNTIEDDNSNQKVVEENVAIPGLDPNLSDNDVYGILSKSAYASKAYALSCVYKLVKDMISQEAALGVMANIWHEGNLGLVQYGKTVPKWDGSNSATSTQNSPLVVSCKENAEAVKGLGVSGNTVGVGIVQWTWYTYMAPLGDSYLTHCTTYSDEELANAEIAMLSPVVNSHAAGLVGSAEDCASYWLIHYERPANMHSKEAARRATATELKTLLNGG